MANSDTSNLSDLQECIASYPVYPIDAPEPPTLMDIAGFPNRENVYSNILAFLLDTRQFHGFGTLFIRAMLGAYCSRCPEEWRKDAPDPEGVEAIDNVEREVSTDRGRIDILIECADFLICIENKIWSDLHNDLGEYRKHCANNSSGRPVLGIVLSPHRIRDQGLQDARFVSIAYGDLVEQVRRRMGSYISPHNTRYQYLLFDFLEQASRFTMTEDQKKFLRFWRENEEKISNIYAHCDKMRGEIKTKAKNHYNQCLEKLTDKEKAVFKTWVYNPRNDPRYDACWVSVFDLADEGGINECRIFLDVEFHPLRVTYYLGNRDKRDESQLSVLAKRISENTKIAFDCYEYPSDSNKILIKQLEDSSLEDSVCEQAVETSVAILGELADMHLENKISNGR